MTTIQVLNKVAQEEGFRDFIALMGNASLAYIQDRCKKAMPLYAQQFIDAADCIIVPAMDILPDTYNEEIDNWNTITQLNK